MIFKVWGHLFVHVFCFDKFSAKQPATATPAKTSFPEKNKFTALLVELLRIHSGVAFNLCKVRTVYVQKPIGCNAVQVKKELKKMSFLCSRWPQTLNLVISDLVVVLQETDDVSKFTAYVKAIVVLIETF